MLPQGMLKRPATAATKSLRACHTPCDPIDRTPIEPTRLPHPWDTPDKSTEIGCHCLLHNSPSICQNFVAKALLPM